MIKNYNSNFTRMFKQLEDNRAVYTRENKPRLTLAAAYIIRERNYLYEYKLPGRDKPRLEKAVSVDFVPFIRSFRVLCKPRLIFSRINGPNVSPSLQFLIMRFTGKMTCTETIIFRNKNERLTFSS